MKQLIALVLCLTVFTVNANVRDFQKGHVLLDLNFDEYQAWYQEMSERKDESLVDLQPETQMAINGGEKMSGWLKLINSKRSSENQVRLTSSTSRGGGIPIDRANKYGPSTIKKRYESISLEMPKVLLEVIYGSKRITSTMPLEEKELVKWFRKVSHLYQTSVRWSGMRKWLSYYAKRRERDVRGYYFLNKMESLDGKLRSYSELTNEKQLELKGHLLGICYNTLKNDKKCEATFKQYLSSAKLVSFKNKYMSNARKVWNSYYVISNPRTDVVWTRSNPKLMSVIFKDPRNTEVAHWLKTNVEEEFKRDLLGWNLEMNYVERGAGLAHLEFKPNVTPHVSGGNTLVMDANTPLGEWDSMWTIRHEYGHILRLPDCYFEFYDSKENLMVNYQLDVTDLMCSRSGDMNDRIYEELKRVYFR
ncbi:hypothetical protein A9Q84_12150 [Halobacteriovorax marinus]|uniref:Uncharacterized protein n=1 Tax=Halobacteriovorax marinus TaxID=97084 RepID=A0A1Y5F823_9BACT|nr:hypothetical protein A9Q84_12150 [Halobacteriovorax marinus]